MYSFSYLKPVCCSMSSSNCCFLTCIQISQDVGQVVWYSHLFQNFPQFIVIHTVKGLGIVNKAEIDVFLELPCFFDDPMDVGNLISGSSAFSKSSLSIWSDQHPLRTSTGSFTKQESSRKTYTSTLLTIPKPLTVWITTNLENSSRDGNTRPPYLTPEKSLCRSRSNS